MAQFVVLLHEMPAHSARATHFDLMFEKDGVLLTWTVADLPVVGETVAAERLPDHRVAYLDYEGPVSGARGSVRRIERGEFQLIESTEARYEVVLYGERLRGRLIVEREDREAQRWRVMLSD